MNDNVAIKVEHVSKRYCKSLKKSMMYGVSDITRNMFGLSSHSDKLRPSEFWALDDVSFELKRGETLGVIGPNGSGKTTLLKTLNGIFWPDKGKITIKGRVGALIAVGAGFHPLLTGRENIYINGAILGMNKKEIDQKFDEIVDFADIGDFLDTPVNYYSSGMFVRLGFAIAIHCDPNIVLIDEILSVGDIKFQAKCLNRIGELRSKDVSFILVSHDIQRIVGYSNKVLALNYGKVYAYGEPENVIEKYTELMNINLNEESPEDVDLPNGSGRIKFENILLYDENNNIVNSIGATKPVYLNIDYKADIDSDNAELVFVIHNSRKEVFFQASNLLYKQSIHIPIGCGSIQIKFPYLPCNNNKLLISVALWNKTRSELYDWERDIEINVYGSPLSNGLVWLPCYFNVLANNKNRSCL